MAGEGLCSAAGRKQIFNEEWAEFLMLKHLS